MNNQEAIKAMHNLNMVLSITPSEREAVNMAIAALEEQKPMKVEKSKSAQYPYKCPQCGYLMEIGYKHCISCGQRVKYEWEEVR